MSNLYLPFDSMEKQEMEITDRICHMVKNKKKKPARNGNSLIIIIMMLKFCNHKILKILLELTFFYISRLDCSIGISTTEKNCISTLEKLW